MTDLTDKDWDDLQRAVNIARCPTHGLHGERTECFVCGGEVEQVRMVPAGDTDASERKSYLIGRYDMLRLLTTSPRFNKPQLELMADLALEMRPELEALGVEFDPAPASPSTQETTP